MSNAGPIRPDAPLPISDYRLFEPLLVLLHMRGFPIGVDDYLKLQVVLERVSPEALLGDAIHTIDASEESSDHFDKLADLLKRCYADLLRPLFACTPQQQQQFDTLFTRSWPEEAARATISSLPSRQFHAPEETSDASTFQGGHAGPALTGDAAEMSGTAGLSPARQAHREKLAALKKRRIDERQWTEEEERRQAEQAKFEAAAQADRAASAARAAIIRRRIYGLAAAAVLLGAGLLIGRKLLLFVQRQIARPVQYAWDDPVIARSANRVALYASQTAKDGPFPEQTYSVGLRRSDRAPFEMNRRDGPRIALARGADPAFSIMWPSDRPDSRLPAHRITVRFRPSKQGSYRTEILVNAPGPRDTVPLPLEIRGQAAPYSPPPREVYAFKGPDGADLTEGIVFPLVGLNARRSAAVTLTERHGHSFTLSGRARIEGADKDLFELTERTSSQAAAQPLSIVFHPRRAYQAALLDAQLVYRTGRADSQDPPDAPIKIASAGAQLAAADASVDVTARPAGYLNTRLNPWIAAGASLATLVALVLILAWLGRKIRVQANGESDEFPDRPLPAARPKGAPFEAPLRSAAEFRPFHGAHFAEAAAQFSPPVRLDDCVDVFDVAATVRATAHRAGYMTPIYQPRRAHPPEYLILIHRRNSRDVRADYFTAFARALVRQGVNLKIFYYAGSPDLCFDTDGTRSIRLDRLHDLYPRRRMLVFGDLDPLVDLPESKVTYAAKTLARWPVRAVFTLDDLTVLGLRLKAIQQDEDLAPFPVLPATQSGQRRFVEAFPVNQSTKRAAADHRDALYRQDQPMPTLPDPTVLTASEYVASLRSALGPDSRLFVWVCACALYPRLFYDLTVLIGTRIEKLAASAEPLVTTDNLRLLLRVPGFGVGEFTNEVRLELQKQLAAAGSVGAAVERDIRTLLIRLLATPPLPPRGSVAYDRFSLERGVQAWLLSQDEHAKWLRSEMKRLPNFVVETHPLLRTFLDQPDKDLWADKTSTSMKAGRPTWIDRWEERWRAFRYRGGMPYRDRLPGMAPYAALLTFAGLIFGLFAIPPFGPTVPNGDLTLTAVSTPAKLSFGDTGSGTSLIARLRVKNSTSAPMELHAEVQGETLGARTPIATRQTIPAGQTDLVELPLLSDALAASPKSVQVLKLSGVLNPMAANPRVFPLVTLPIELRRVGVRFDRAELALTTDGNTPASNGVVRLIGRKLPLAQDVQNLLSIEPPGAFLARVQTATSDASGETVLPVVVTYRPSRAQVQGTMEHAALIYTDNSGASTSVALSGSSSIRTDFAAAPPTVKFTKSLFSPRDRPIETVFERRQLRVSGPVGGTIKDAQFDPDADQTFRFAVSSLSPTTRVTGIALKPDGSGRASATLSVAFAPVSAGPHYSTLRLQCDYLGHTSILSVPMSGTGRSVDPILASGRCDDASQNPVLKLAITAASYASRFSDSLADAGQYSVEISPTAGFISTATRRMQIIGKPAVSSASGTVRIAMEVREPGVSQSYSPGSKLYLRLRFTGLTAIPAIGRGDLKLTVTIPAPPIAITARPRAVDFGSAHVGGSNGQIVSVTGPADLKIVSLTFVNVNASGVQPAAVDLVRQTELRTLAKDVAALVSRQRDLNRRVKSLLSKSPNGQTTGQPDFQSYVKEERDIADKAGPALQKLAANSLPNLALAAARTSEQIRLAGPVLDDRTSTSLPEVAKMVDTLTLAFLAVQASIEGAIGQLGVGTSEYSAEYSRVEQTSAVLSAYAIALKFTAGSAPGPRSATLRVRFADGRPPLDVPVTATVLPRAGGESGR